MLEKINTKINSKYAVVSVIFISLIALGLIILAYFSISLPGFPGFSHFPFLSQAPEIKDIEKFSSEEDFKAYLQEAQLGYGDFLGGADRVPSWTEVQPGEIAIPSALKETGDGMGGGGEPERVSTTNVQVLGIDEPDIVKTDGKEIYFSSTGYYLEPWVWESEKPYPSGQETKIIKAFPSEDLAIENKIDKQGDLLLKGNILVIFSGDKIYGYDITTPKNPKKKWTIDLENQNYIVGARLYKDKIYLVTSTRIDTYHPCPIKPLSVEGAPLEIKCVDIYHPVASVPVDVAYSGMIINPESGKVDKTISFVGTSGSSIIYMSENAIYITYVYSESIIKFYTNFFKESCRDIIPSRIIEKLEKLESYDISDVAKLTEFSFIFENYIASLSDDDRLKINNEIENRMKDYYKEHGRELGRTGIVKVGLDEFKVLASGNIPGQILNQFSMDEYQNYLRVATTINGGWWGGIGSTGESANDIYVLDSYMKISGSIKDLALGERIYSVRFIEDKGYVVTFKQVDPFFIIDLSNPKKPELKGELKIPGYSSYLHPITKDKILGFGKEGSNVKISLFDVASPSNPSEIDKYNLDEYWSDILNTHHAFLLDEKHEIFFLPGGQGGYVFSYKDNKLELKRAVSDIQAKRAIYINDYLYIIGDSKVTVLNELNWEKVNELEL